MSMKSKCPRCGNEKRLKPKGMDQIKCNINGHKCYFGYWRQFFEGEKAREAVQQLFKEGKLEGDPLLGSAKKPL